MRFKSERLLIQQSHLKVLYRPNIQITGARAGRPGPRGHQECTKNVLKTVKMKPCALVLIERKGNAPTLLI